MRPYSYTLAAGQHVQLGRAGRHITVTDSIAPFNVQVMDSKGMFEEGELQQGISWEYSGQDPKFEYIVITNTSDEENQITLVVSNGRYTDRRNTRAEIGINGDALVALQAMRLLANISTTSISGSETVTTAAAVDVVDANAANRRISIQPQGGAIYVRKGADATKDSDSFLLSDGQFYECDTTERISAIGSTGDVATFIEVQRN